jgi:ketosteroid isomerase-like protein
MRPHPIALALALATAVGLACAGTPAATDITGVKAAINDLRTVVNGRDSAGFYGLLADDFEAFPPGIEPAKGRAARDLFKDLFTASSVTLGPFTNEEIVVNGDLAVQRYTFRLTVKPSATAAAATEAGSGLHVWRRSASGKWQLWKDIWTEPASPAAKS